MITVQQIRDKYPKPRTYSGTYVTNTRLYCVGGAVVRFASPTASLPYRSGFPGYRCFAFALCDLNHHLSFALAESFATRAIMANDRGEFEAAWQIVDEALSWRPIMDSTEQEVCHG